MKRRVIIIICVLSSVLFFSCQKPDNEDGVIWDVAPVNIMIYVQDQYGKDLVDTLASDFLNDQVKAVYKGRDYFLGVNAWENSEITPSPETKAYLARFYGLHVVKYYNEFILNFGEFDGTKDWDESFEIFWKDGSKDTISFEHDFEWGEDGVPEFRHQALYLNGEKVEGRLIIVK